MTSLDFQYAVTAYTGDNYNSTKRGLAGARVTTIEPQ